MILNLGCGTRTSSSAINVDWSIYQRLASSLIGRAVASIALRGERLERFRSMDGSVVVHDLRRGIPATDNSVDAVYHSHMLEHIELADVPLFFAEVLRVLKPGGIHRVVVPDLELHTREYIAHLEAGAANHDEAIYPILGQAVRREAHGTSLQSPLRRRVENLVLGDARRRGETHQWMYDELNLRQALECNGFTDVRRVDECTSSIHGWTATGLDTNPDGSTYRPGSLFMEARKP